MRKRRAGGCGREWAGGEEEKEEEEAEAEEEENLFQGDLIICKLQLGGQCTLSSISTLIFYTEKGQVSWSI